MEQIGVLFKKILDWKTGVKNSRRKMDRKHLSKVLCQWLKTTQWLKILSSDGNTKTYVGGWQPCYDLCVIGISYNVMCV